MWWKAAPAWPRADVPDGCGGLRSPGEGHPGLRLEAVYLDRCLFLSGFETV